MTAEGRSDGARPEGRSTGDDTGEATGDHTGEATGDAAADRAGETGADQPVTFDRHMVLEQLGGWRGMVDATLPTVAFIVANSIAGLRTGIWAALIAAGLVFLFRLVRRQSVQQALSGLFGVAIAVAIAAWSGQARDYFVPGIIRNTAIGVVLLGSIALRRPLIGYAAEFLAPSHLGSLAGASLPGLRRRMGQVNATLHHRPAPDPVSGRRTPDPEPVRHWREDPRVLRAYSWLTALWAGTFLLRVVVQTPLYLSNEVGLLGTASLVLGLPVTGIALGVTLWVVARLHRHRSAEADDAAAHAPGEDGPGRRRPAA